MTSPSSPDPVTRLYRACNPKTPVSPEDPRYVSLDDVRGANLPLQLARDLHRADPTEPQVKVFAGHRGVGKTSELLRLKGMLEDPSDSNEKPFHVVFTDVLETLDPNDLDFPDLLVFLAGEVQKQLREAQIPGFSATSELLKNVWDNLKSQLAGDVELTGASVETPFASLAVELKNRPSARKHLRHAIERQSTNLLYAVNDLLTLATVKLQEAGKAGLVLIVDGLDKLVRRQLDGGTNTHERLFIHRSEQLASLKAHVIYTVPIPLVYSQEFTQLEQTFGEHHVPVSMIRLRGEDQSSPTPETAGMRKMKEIVEARCRFAEVAMDEVFDSRETCVYLCEMTGGHPRHLMMFLQAAAGQVDTLPITREAAGAAVRNYANSLFREIPDEFWPALREFDDPQETIPKDEIHQQMLLLLHVFEYMNGHPWYEVNPVLRTLDKFDEH